jgi:hypothetical protein
MRQMSSVPGWNRLQRLLAALSLILLSLGALPGAVGAQQGGAGEDDVPDSGVISDTAWESPQFGAGVTWGGDFELVDDPEWTFSDPDLGMDSVSLGTDTLYFSVTYISSPGETPDEYMDRVADLRADGVNAYSLVSRDANANGNVTSLIYLGDDRGDLYVAANEVTWFDEDAGILQFVVLNAWVDEAADGFAAAQDDIEVDGEAPFQLIEDADLDESALEQDDTEQADEAGSSDTGQAEDDEDTADAGGPNIKDNNSDRQDEEAEDASSGESDDTAEDESADTAGRGDTPDDDTEDANTNGPTAEATPSAGDQAALGIVGRRDYVSPQFDAEITWGRPWSVVDGNLASDTQGKQDNLALIDTDDNLFQATFFATKSETPEAYMTRLIAFRTDLASTKSLEVLDQGTVGDRVYAIYVMESADGSTIYELSEVGQYKDGVLFKVEMQVDPANVQDAFAAMQDEIQVDGDAPFVFDGDFPEVDE